MISEALLMPGNIGNGLSTPASRMSWVHPGVTMNWAPAASVAANICRSSTVPAPTHSSGRCSRSMRMALRPCSLRKVISRVFKPPAARASASGRMSSSRAMVMTGRIFACAQSASIWATLSAIRFCFSSVVIAADPWLMGTSKSLKKNEETRGSASGRCHHRPLHHAGLSICPGR
ncbi:hypothetical protein D3C76_1088020 [compost metagenome]